MKWLRNWLTPQEEKVLWIIIALILIGWTVRTFWINKTLQ